jgi:hypothetical protein
MDNRQKEVFYLELWLNRRTKGLIFILLSLICVVYSSIWLAAVWRTIAVESMATKVMLSSGLALTDKLNFPGMIVYLHTLFGNDATPRKKNIESYIVICLEV